MQINWKFFSLEQINSKEGPEWKVWEQGPEYASRGLPAFRHALAARRQDPDAFTRFHLALLRARHEQGRDLTDAATLQEVAREAGLDLDRLGQDLADPHLLDGLAEDHLAAVTRYGAFGTPTIVFPNGAAAYLQLRPTPPPEEALAVWEQLAPVIADRPFVLELKRPKRPQ